MAEQTIDAAQHVIGQRNPCQTKKAYLLGAAGYDPQAIVASGGMSAHLGERYGTEARFVSDLMQAAPALQTPIVQGLPYTEAEVLYAVRHELAGTVEDVLSRRMRARLMARDASALAAARVGQILQSELGLAPTVITQQVNDYLAAIQHEKSRGYNRGNYVVGAHTPPAYAAALAQTGSEPGLQRDPVRVSTGQIDALRHVADEVLTDTTDVVAWTRDWWAGSRMSETGGKPATPQAVIVRVSSVEQVQAVMRIANADAIPVTVSAGRSNVTGAALPVRGGIVLDVCQLNKLIGVDRESQIVEVEAGMFGDVFEETIQNEYGLTMGHWPSSFGISTVGGWAACRGAGQLSTRYGKIDDMVYGMDEVLAKPLHRARRSPSR
ncbi:hypothetical protein G6F68_009796 [Rhizopus microsporus]|nr:hypothetical protein G6F68_009796 [Rhizopus microsporus]